MTINSIMRHIVSVSNEKNTRQLSRCQIKVSLPSGFNTANDIV